MASEESQQVKAAIDNGDGVDFTFSMPLEGFFGGYVKGSLENDGCRCCCVNFNCVAVFCECFRAGEYCAKGCLDCRNNPANEDMIHDLRQRKASFIPLPLKRKLVQLATRSTQNSGVRTFDKGFLMADETTVNGVDSILDPTMSGISKEHPDFEEHDKISALERQIADLEDEKLAIIQENKEQKEKIKLMTLEIDGFKKSKEEMAERLEKMQAEINRLEVDKKAPKAIAARASDLETEVFRMQHDLQPSMSECEDNREELQKLTGECEALKQSNREMKSKIDNLEKEMEFAILQMKKSEAETRKRVQLLQEEVKASVSTKEKLKKAKQDVETLKSSLEERLKQPEAKSEEMDRIIKDLNKKNELMEVRLIAYAEEKAEMEKTILEMEKELEKEDVMEESADGGRRGFKFQWPVAAAASTGTIVAAVAMIYLRNARQKQGNYSGVYHVLVLLYFADLTRACKSSAFFLIQR